MNGLGPVTGAAWVRAVPAGAKLLTLAVCAVLITVTASSPVLACGVLGGVVIVHLCAGLGLRALALTLWRLKWAIVLLAGSALVFVSVQSAITTTTRVLAILLLAEVVTCTTSATAMLAAIERALWPLRCFGVDPARAALAIQLAVSAIPVIAAHATRVREAQTARGVRLGWRAVLPMLVLSLRHADDVGDALRARGIA